MPVRPAGTLFLLCSLLLTACGGGGGSNNPDIQSQDASPEEGRLLAFSDVEPILQARCTGCHNSGDNPLAPFSLEGEQRATQFQSAIHFTVDSGTMPPAGTPPLLDSEKARLIAWSTRSPYNEANEILRIPLIVGEAWDVQPKNRDVFIDLRPEEVDCDNGSGWLVEDGALEIRTEFCNYLSLTQQALLELAEGTELELAWSHSDLNFNAPAEAHIALSISGHHHLGGKDSDTQRKQPAQTQYHTAIRCRPWRPDRDPPAQPRRQCLDRTLTGRFRIKRPRTGILPDI